MVTGEDRDLKQPRKVLAVLTHERKVIVEGVNVNRDRQKAQGGRQSGINAGGMVEKPAPIAISNVMLVDPKSHKPTRVRTAKGQDGKVVRTAVRSGEHI